VEYLTSGVRDARGKWGGATQGREREREKGRRKAGRREGYPAGSGNVQEVGIEAINERSPRHAVVEAGGGNALGR
jgi:hypothetical protein